ATALLLMAALRNADDLVAMVWAHVVGTAILVYMALFVFQMVAEANGITRLSNLDTWDANDIGVLLLMALPMCLLLVKTSTKPLSRAFALLVAVGIGAAIARSGSRGGFIGMAAVMGAY